MLRILLARDGHFYKLMMRARTGDIAYRRLARGTIPPLNDNATRIDTSAARDTGTPAANHLAELHPEFPRAAHPQRQAKEWVGVGVPRS